MWRSHLRHTHQCGPYIGKHKKLWGLRGFGARIPTFKSLFQIAVKKCPFDGLSDERAAGMMGTVGQPIGEQSEKSETAITPDEMDTRS